MLDEQRQINRNGCGDPRLTASAPADTPQFTHPPRRHRASAGNSAKGLTFTRIERPTESSFQNREPGTPGTEIAKPSTEHPRIEQRAIDLNHRRPHSFRVDAARSTDRLT